MPSNCANASIHWIELSQKRMLNARCIKINGTFYIKYIKTWFMSLNSKWHLSVAFFNFTCMMGEKCKQTLISAIILRNFNLNCVHISAKKVLVNERKIRQTWLCMLFISLSCFDSTRNVQVIFFLICYTVIKQMPK